MLQTTPPLLCGGPRCAPRGKIRSAVVLGHRGGTGGRSGRAHGGPRRKRVAAASADALAAPELLVLRPLELPIRIPGVAIELRPTGSGRPGRRNRMACARPIREAAAAAFAHTFATPSLLVLRPLELPIRVPVVAIELLAAARRRGGRGGRSGRPPRRGHAHDEHCEQAGEKYADTHVQAPAIYRGPNDVELPLAGSYELVAGLLPEGAAVPANVPHLGRGHGLAAVIHARAAHVPAMAAHGRRG
mmetsp:Transcript_55587/g.169050  ORF Transcript_55587/g.169050 Transcript_55587/m.169050 type:complete len:245 (+) Transcript_55587:923-1657(+)